MTIAVPFNPHTSPWQGKGLVPHRHFYNTYYLSIVPIDAHLTLSTYCWKLCQRSLLIVSVTLSALKIDSLG